MSINLRQNPCLKQDCITRYSTGRLNKGSRRSTLSGEILLQKKTVFHKAKPITVFAAATAEQSDSEQAPAVTEKKEWIALLANAEFMLKDVQNESLAEQLREKVRLYKERKKELDFFLVPEPSWLDVHFAERAKRIGRPCVALVSSDPVWTRYMKTRLDQVMEIRLGDLPKEEVLKSNGDLPELKDPDIWRAPYSPYSPGWWTAFYPNLEESKQQEDETTNNE